LHKPTGSHLRYECLRKAVRDMNPGLTAGEYEDLWVDMVMEWHDATYTVQGRVKPVADVTFDEAHMGKRYFLTNHGDGSYTLAVAEPL
jgi:hypothetical protein